MVKKLFTLFIFFISLQAVGQNTYLDEIQLMDYFRNRQLIGNTEDSLLVKQQSFMIRSTFTFQNLFYTSSPKDNGLRIKSFLFSDNRLNNSHLPISSNDGNLIPAKGLQERASIGISDGLIRFSIGLDHDIKRTYQKMKECMLKVGVLNHHENISIS